MSAGKHERTVFDFFLDNPDKTGSATPTLSQIAGMLGLAYQDVQVAVKALEKRGLIRSWVVRGERGGFGKRKQIEVVDD